MAVVIPIISTFDSKGVTSAITNLRNLFNSNKTGADVATQAKAQ